MPSKPRLVARKDRAYKIPEPSEREKEKEKEKENVIEFQTVQETEDADTGDSSEHIDIDSQSECAESMESTKNMTLERKKQARKHALNLTDEQESTLIDWLIGNDMLYNKGSKEYKDTQKKTRMWNDMATEMNVPGKQMYLKGVHCLTIV